jgi:hypothetical protein
MAFSDHDPFAISGAGDTLRPTALAARSAKTKVSFRAARARRSRRSRFWVGVAIVTWAGVVGALTALWLQRSQVAPRRETASAPPAAAPSRPVVRVPAETILFAYRRADAPPVEAPPLVRAARPRVAIASAPKPAPKPRFVSKPPVENRDSSDEVAAAKEILLHAKDEHTLE